MWQQIWQCWKHFGLYQLKACTEEIEAGVALTTLSCTYGPSNKERGQLKPWELLHYINIPTNRLSLSLLRVTLLCLSFLSLSTIDTNNKCHIHWVTGFGMWPQLCFMLWRGRPTPFFPLIHSLHNVDASSSGEIPGAHNEGLGRIIK